jgi:hypothetical protein
VHGESPASRSARDHLVAGIDHGIAPENGRDIRPGQIVAVALWASRALHSEAATGNNSAVAR